MTRITIALAFLLASLAGTVQAQSNSKTERPARPQPDRIIVYKTVGDIELTLHLFAPPDYKPESDHRPAIVFFFGGGWVKGSPSQFYGQCAHLAARGMVAMSADYRTKNAYQTTPQECVKDGKSAVRWIRSHADELGIDPDMLAAGGGSAGGQVAAATGTVAGFNEEGEDTSVSCIPNALVLFNPVIDNGPEGYGYDRVADYWQAFSPLNNVNEHTPPTIIMLGTEDPLIPVATVEKFKQLLAEFGTRCDLCLYEGRKHGFFNSGESYEQTLQAADRFLTSLGFLPPLPDSEESSTAVDQSDNASSAGE